MKIKSSNMPFIRCIPAVLAFTLIIAAAFFAFSDMSESASSEGVSITEKSIRRAVITCYAQEGSYPQSIDYLKENYGLFISDGYIVYYDIFASNIMPDIQVVRKQVSK